MKSIRTWAASLTISALVLAAISGSSAQDTKKPYEKHDTTALYRSLGDVINTGAELYNHHSDYAGCYRMFQGSLIAVRPFLAPDLQKRIDAGLAAAEKEPKYAERAFQLRRVLDDVRTQLRPAGATTDVPQSPPNTVVEKKAEKIAAPRPNTPASPSGKGQIAGKLLLQNMPVTGGYYVTVSNSDKRYSSTVQKNGSFQFTTAIPPGNYRVAIEPIKDATIQRTAIPPRYSSEATSGLTLHVQSGKQTVELNLVK